MRFFLLIFLLTSAPIFGAEQSMTMTITPPIIGTNDTAEIAITVVDFTLSSPPTPTSNSDDYNISYLGSSIQRSASISGGSAVVRTQYSYLYQFIPNKVGSYKIPSFIGKDKNGTTVYSTSATIEVQDIATTQQRSQGNTFNPFGGVFDNGPGNAYVYWDVPMDDVTQNVGFLVNLYFFTDNPNFLNNLDDLKILERPSFKGGIIYEIPVDNTNTKSEYLGGRTFYGKIFKQYVAYPLDSGQLTFIQPSILYDNGIFNSYIPGESGYVTSLAQVGGLSYIGDTLALKSELNTNMIESGKDIQLTLEISGSGNADFFANPLQNITIDNLFISEPETSIEMELLSGTTTNINMTKQFIYTLIPQNSGIYKIPPVVLSYKNLYGQPKTVTSQELSFTALVSAIQNITTSLTKITTPRTTIYFASALPYILMSLLLGSISMLLTWIYTNHINKLATDTVFARSSGADKKLKKFLSASEKALSENNNRDSARLLRQSILSYCADRFGLAPSSSPSDIINYFNTNNYDFPQQKLFIDLLTSLDFYAFGSTPSTSQMKNHFDDALSLLQNISKIKK